MSAFARRRFLNLALGAFASRAFAGQPPLRITSIEPIVIRTPKDSRSHEEFIEMPPVGHSTGGKGLWNRLDHASPSRFHGATRTQKRNSRPKRFARVSHRQRQSAI